MVISNAMLVAGGALLLTLMLGVVVAMVAGRMAEEQTLRARLSEALDQRARTPRTVKGFGSRLGVPFRALGGALRNTALFNDKDLHVLERAVTASGLHGPSIVQAFVGAKVVLLLMLPTIGFLVAQQFGQLLPGKLLAMVFGLMVAIIGSAIALRQIVGPYQRQLRLGLPDALDLLVVCAEAGLGVETALQRVATELKRSNPPLAHELAVLSQELRLLPDRSEALARFAARSSDERFRQTAATLSQTMRYGTPLAQALRILAGDLRNRRLLRLEERAVRLPALLAMPMILFMLPSLFIALAAPSLVGIIDMMGSQR
jgi:tight adherence protein C